MRRPIAPTDEFMGVWIPVVHGRVSLSQLKIEMRPYELQPCWEHTRYGQQRGEATLAGRKLPIERPRVRNADGGGELPLETIRNALPDSRLTRFLLDQRQLQSGPEEFIELLEEKHASMRSNWIVDDLFVTRIRRRRIASRFSPRLGHRCRITSSFGG
jgi:hypothetical protein